MPRLGSETTKEKAQKSALDFWTWMRKEPGADLRLWVPWVAPSTQGCYIWGVDLITGY